MNRNRIIFPLVTLLVMMAVGCSQPQETATEAPPPNGIPAQTQAGQDTGLASPKRELKDRANAAAQSNESPVGAPKANMQ